MDDTGLELFSFMLGGAIFAWIGVMLYVEIVIRPMVRKLIELADRGE